MRLGGFVIHGNNVDTLARCLDSLAAVCDEVVAVDSLSTDGSAALVDRAGFRRVEHAWRGYGAARRAAMGALGHCDYVLFLDSDEWLEAPAREAIRAWKKGEPRRAYYRLPRRDWAMLPARTFLFRTQHHKRLVRRDHAVWRDDMIVHEALPKGDAGALGAFIEHRFATSVETRRDKEDLYALLWALRVAREGRRVKVPVLQRLAHVLRDGVLKGALFRGGAEALALAVAVSRYHAQKYRYLGAIRRGAFSSRVEAFDAGRYGELFRPLDEAEKAALR